MKPSSIGKAIPASLGMKAYYGNKEVVALARAILREAKKGDLATLAFAAQRPPDNVCFSWAGAHGGIEDTIKGLTILKGEMEEVAKPRRAGPQKEGMDLSHVEYNTGTQPLNYDFIVWLAHSEMNRIAADAPGPLRVGFRGKNNLTEQGKRVFEAILRKSLILIGAVETDHAIGGWRNASLTTGEMVVGARRGLRVPVMRADDLYLEQATNWLYGKPAPIVITLREASHWEFRNSNLDAWTRFAGDLKAKGEYVVFIRDTEKANLPLGNFDTCPRASFEIRMRMAMYAKAKCNFFISNGPATLAVLSPYPYIYFMEMKRVGDYDTNTPGWWESHHGIVPGEQWPWAQSNQRMVWEADTYENLSAAWEKYSADY